MRLNHDYVRDLLLFLSDKLKNVPISCHKLIADDKFKNYNKDELLYAFKLLYQEGYVASAKKPIHDANKEISVFYVSQLTWKGHELLDNVRNKTVWEVVKDKASKIGNVSLSALAAGANTLTTALMSDPNAVDNFLKGVENIGQIFK